MPDTNPYSDLPFTVRIVSPHGAVAQGFDFRAAWICEWSAFWLF